MKTDLLKKKTVFWFNNKKHWEIKKSVGSFKKKSIYNLLKKNIKVKFVKD